MSKGSGPDIDLDVMLDLADNMFETDLSKMSLETSLGYGVFYIGVSSLFYPVSRSTKGGNIIKWHSDLSAERFVPPFDRFLPVESQADFNQLRHILEFAPHSKVQLGTQERSQAHV
jgi:hypothetical protein